MPGLEQVLQSSGLDIGALAQRFGISPDQANAALGSLMPAVAGGIQKKAQTGDVAPVADAGASMGEPDAASGNTVLGHIFGNKDVSRQVADHAAGQTGLSSELMQSMLPVVAAMAAKHFANAGGGAAPAGGGLGGIFGSLLGGAGGQGGNPLENILAGRL